jgi:hypothetical protein
VSKLLGVATGATGAARRVGLRSLAEKELPEPERQPLLANPSRAVDQ